MRVLETSPNNGHTAPLHSTQIRQSRTSHIRKPLKTQNPLRG